MHAFTLHIPTEGRLFLLLPILLLALVLRAFLAPYVILPLHVCLPLLGIGLLCGWIRSGHTTLSYCPCTATLTFSTGRWFCYRWQVPCDAVVAHYRYTTPLLCLLHCKVVVLQTAGHHFVLPAFATADLTKLWAVLS